MNKFLNNKEKARFNIICEKTSSLNTNSMNYNIPINL